jgi:predicted deacylase
MDDGILNVVEIQGSRPGPHLLITGGIHGDEFEPMSAIRELGRLLEPQALMGHVTLIPVANEPAYRCGRRTGEDGLDLARTFPGCREGSVTQRIAFTVSQRIRAADYYIDLHSGGTALRVWPMVGYMLHSNQEVLASQRRMARAFGLPVVWGTTSQLEGRSLSVARDADVPAIYAEYLGGGGCDPRGLQAYVEGCLNVLATLRMLERKTSDFTPEYVVEDERPESGHMQICYPAPIPGLFVPAVQLGDAISVGDPIGRLLSPLNDESITVRSTQGGRVLALRDFAQVNHGDSLAVILEVGHS